MKLNVFYPKLVFLLTTIPEQAKFYTFLCAGNRVRWYGASSAPCKIPTTLTGRPDNMKQTLPTP